MNHLTEEDLILHYYGEGDDTLDAERHLETCPECRRQYSSVQLVLNTVDSLSVPARGEDYGAAVWHRIEGRIGGRIEGRRRWLPWLPQWRWAATAAAMAALVIAAFLTGRYYPPTRTGGTMAADRQVREKVLLVAVGDYLERSQMVLVELANARPSGPLDVSSEQGRARDLVSETRLYRQTAANTGASDVAAILDELERVMVDLARGPSELSPAQLEQWRQRLEAAGIIFKIRVVNSNVRNREDAEQSTSRQSL